MAKVTRVTVDLSNEWAEDRKALMREIVREGFKVHRVGLTVQADFAENDEDERNHSTRSEYTELLDSLGMVYSTDFEVGD